MGPLTSRSTSPGRYSNAMKSPTKVPVKVRTTFPTRNTVMGNQVRVGPSNAGRTLGPSLRSSPAREYRREPLFASHMGMTFMYGEAFYSVGMLQTSSYEGHAGLIRSLHTRLSLQPLRERR